MNARDVCRLQTRSIVESCTSQISLRRDRNTTENRLVELRQLPPISRDEIRMHKTNVTVRNPAHFCLADKISGTIAPSISLAIS